MIVGCCTSLPHYGSPPIIFRGRVLKSATSNLQEKSGTWSDDDTKKLLNVFEDYVMNKKTPPLPEKVASEEHMLQCSE